MRIKFVDYTIENLLRDFKLNLTMLNEKIYASTIVFGLVWFYGISIFVGYLMPNPFLCK